MVEKVGESVAAPVEKASSRPKRRPMLKEKHLPPPIVLLEYTWVDKKVGIYFSCYNHE